MAELAPHKRQDVTNNRVDVDRAFAGHALRHELTDALDHLSRTVPFRHDGVEGFADLVKVGTRGGEPVQRRP